MNNLSKNAAVLWTGGKDSGLALYEAMLRTYLFEENLHLLYRQGELVGGLYTGSGNEAVAVGAAFSL